MLILLRLAEDVITFQTLPTQRRRDIQQTLTQNMESIFSFMMGILQVNVEDYRKLVSGVQSSFMLREVRNLREERLKYVCFVFKSRKGHLDMNCR